MDHRGSETRTYRAILLTSSSTVGVIIAIPPFISRSNSPFSPSAGSPPVDFLQHLNSLQHLFPDIFASPLSSSPPHRVSCLTAPSFCIASCPPKLWFNPPSCAALHWLFNCRLSTKTILPPSSLPNHSRFFLEAGVFPIEPCLSMCLRIVLGVW